MLDFAINVNDDAADDVVVDVVGYFITPQATALDCNLQSPGTIVTAASGDGCQTATCTAGFSVTGGGINVASAPPSTAAISESKQGTGEAWVACIHNLSGAATVTWHTQARCCRVPGR